MSFRIRVLRAMELKGIRTQEALAAAAGIEPSTLSAILTGRSQNPRWLTLKKIIEGLGMTPEEFWSFSIEGEEGRAIPGFPNARVLRAIGRDGEIDPDDLSKEDLAYLSEAVNEFNVALVRILAGLGRKETSADATTERLRGRQEDEQQ